MPQTFTCLHYHLVFSTKRREPLIAPDVRPRLWEYIGGTVRGLGGMPILTGGTADHVHLLATLRPTHALADFMRDLKAGTSSWVHDTFPDLKGFAWQPGYGAFTVSQSGVEAVKAYIAHQEEHHRKQTFQEEFREFLRNHEIPFEENRLWE
jgi:REP element-mobilizing transposase RayT